MKDPESVCRLRDALESLYRIIDKAGISNLANGVQLGQMSWLVKVGDAMDQAKHVLNTTTCACKLPTTGNQGAYYPDNTANNATNTVH